MVESVSDTEDELKALHEIYKEQLPQRIQQLEEVWETLHNNEDWDLTTLKKLHLLTHKLVGSSASYGFGNLSYAIRQLEIALKTLIKSEEPPTSNQTSSISELLTALQTADFTSDEEYEETTSTLYTPATERTLADDVNNLIVVVEDDAAQAKELSLQISHFGYYVQTYTELRNLEEFLESCEPAAIVTDIIFPEGEFAGIEAIRRIQQKREQPIPVIFISSHSDLATRLEVVRVGGRAYFGKPINISNLIDRLDNITTKAQPEPYRVLIVDDDPALAAHHAKILQQANIRTNVVSDPMQVIQPLVEFAPDLILMDVYMPGCTGIELAAVIRQQEAFVSIPIVFLSAETDLSKQLEAMSLGGDDFLTKPIQPAHLISSVTARAQRSRILRNFMTTDGLTGLLNHTTTKGRLDTELARGRRYNQPLSFAMLDVDHFKQVNDTYGHAIGDQVLRSLARLLQQRLRRTDIIGRYGGEEFAVILPNTTNEEALRLMEEVRTNFSQILQQSAVTDFHCTFSCGVASFPRYESSNRLIDAADAAMYKAKKQGRNRGVSAQ